MAQKFKYVKIPRQEKSKIEIQKKNLETLENFQTGSPTVIIREWGGVWRVKRRKCLDFFSSPDKLW